MDIKDLGEIARDSYPCENFEFTNEMLRGLTEVPILVHDSWCDCLACNFQGDR